MSHHNALQTLYEQTLARAEAGQPAFDEPVTEAPAIGAFLKRTSTGGIFRVLCNCATATPKENTLREVSTDLSRFTWPSHDELAEHFRPRLVHNA